MTIRKEDFRNYSSGDSGVKRTYQNMQENQNCLFVRKMKKRYTSPSGYTDASHHKIRKPIMDVFHELDKIIDESDPDTDLAQIFHAYQTGEALRALLEPGSEDTLKSIPIQSLFSETEWEGLPADIRESYTTTVDALYPEITDWSWLALTGFLHDLGKVLAASQWGSLPQWAVVGDTFPVGAPFSNSNVYAECGFFKKNPDLLFAGRSSDQFGRYPKRCGFDKVEMSWGHDEYCYSVLNRTENRLPSHALYLIRFHSFYPWHTPRNGERGYTELASARDWKMLPLLKMFHQCDLYSKKNAIENHAELKTFYQGLVERFVPGRKETGYHLRPAGILW